MRTFLLILAVPAAVVVLYFVHSIFKYTRLITNIFLGLKYSPPQEPQPPSAGERVVILDSGGNEIEAMLVEKKGAKNVAIFCHDSGSTKESWEKYAYFLPELGFRVLAVDFVGAQPDSGKNSLTQWPTEDEVARLVLVVRWAKNAFGPDAGIVLFGVSKGADLALAASFREPAVRGVVTDGLFSMREIFRDYIRKWAPILVRPNFFGEKFPEWIVHTFSACGFWYCQRAAKKRFVDVEGLLRRNRGPLLMIHGEADDYIPSTHQKVLHRLQSRRKSAEPLIVPNAGHNEGVVLDRDSYERAVIEFLRKIVP